MDDNPLPNPTQLQPSESDLESCDLHPIEPVKMRLMTYTRHSSPSPLRLRVDDTWSTSPQQQPVSDLHKLVIPTRQPRPRVPRSRILSRCQVLESSPTPLQLNSKIQHAQYLTRSQTRQPSPSPLTLMNIHQDVRYLTRSRVKLWKQRGRQPCPVHGKIIRRQLPRHQSTPKLQLGRTISHHRSSPGKVKAKQDLFRDSSSDVQRGSGPGASYAPSPRKMKTNSKDKGTAPRRMGFMTKMRNFATRVQKTVSKAVSSRRAVDVTAFSNVQQTSDVQWVELNSRQKQNYFTGSTEDLDSTLPVTCFRAKKVKVTKPNPAKAHIKRLMKVKQQRTISTPARAKRLSMLQSTSQVPLIRSQDESATSTASCQQYTTKSAPKPSIKTTAIDQQQSFASTAHQTCVEEPAAQGLPNSSPDPSTVPPIIIKKTAVVTTKPSFVTERVSPIIIRRTSTVVNPLSLQEVSTSTQESSCESSCLTEATKASLEAPPENATQASLEEPPENVSQTSLEEVPENVSQSSLEEVPENVSQSSLEEPPEIASNISSSRPNTTNTAHHHPDCTSIVQRPRDYRWISPFVRSKIQRIIEGAPAESESITTQQPTSSISGMNKKPPNTSQSTSPTLQGSSVTSRPQPSPRVAISGQGQSARSPPSVHTSCVVSASSQPPEQTSHEVSACSQPPKQTSPVVSASTQPPGQTSCVVTACSQPPEQTSHVVSDCSQPPKQTSPVVSASTQPPEQTSCVDTACSQPPEQTSHVVSDCSQPPKQTSPVVSASSQPPGQTSHDSVKQPSASSRKEQSKSQPANHITGTTSRGAPTQPKQQPCNEPGPSVTLKLNLLPNSDPSIKEEAATFLVYFTTYGQTREKLKALIARTLSQQLLRGQVLRRETLIVIFNYLLKKNLLRRQDVYSIQLNLRQQWLMIQQSSTKPSTNANANASDGKSPTRQSNSSTSHQVNGSSQMSTSKEKTMTASIQTVSSADATRPSTSSTPVQPSQLLKANPSAPAQRLLAHTPMIPVPQISPPSKESSPVWKMSAPTLPVTELAQQIPATDQQDSAPNQQSSAASQQMSAMTQHMSASTLQMSATTKKVSATTQQVSATTQQMSASTQHMSASIQQMSASTQHMSASTQHMSARTQQMSASTQQMSARTQQMSARTQQMSASTQQMSATHSLPTHQPSRTTVPSLLSSSTNLMPVPKMTPLSLQISAPNLQVSAPVTQISAQRISAPNLQFSTSTLLIPAPFLPLSTPTLGNHAPTQQMSFNQSTTLSSVSRYPVTPNISVDLEEEMTDTPLDVHHQMPPSSPTSVTPNPVRTLMLPSATASHSQPFRSQDKPPSGLGLVIPSIRVHQNERSLHDDIRELDILSASKSKKRSYPEDRDDAELYPLQKKRFSYSDLLPTNRAWCSSSVKSDPRVCKKCDGINEILHETPENLDKYWISRPTERSPEKNWCYIIPRLCSQIDGRPHLLAKGLVWRLFTIEQLYGNRFHSLDEAVTSKIRLIVQSRTGCDGDHWRRKCIPFINSSIRQLFNNKLRKYEHLLNHTCCPDEQMMSTTPNTCTDIVPYRS